MAKEAEKLRLQSDEELKALLLDSQAERFRLRNALVKKDKDVKFQDMKSKRRTIARVHTILRERERVGFEN